MENIIFDSVKGSHILFGTNYIDKVFLCSILEFTKHFVPKLIKTHPCYSIHEFNDFKDNSKSSFLDNYEVNILGLSTQSDKHIIKILKNRCKRINIYCNSDRNYNDWTQEMNDYEKCNFYCLYEYDGFENNHNKCINLCKKYKRK